MSADVVKEFMVLLGYSIDGGSQAKFEKAIEAGALKAKLLGDAIEGAARAVHDSVAAMAKDLEQLYFASQRTKASAENIRAFQLAMQQAGGSAEGALGAIESIARFMRNNPAGEGFIQGLGVQTRQANGALRDTADIVGDLGKSLAAKPTSLANAYGGVLGLDERTLLAMRNGLDDYAKRYHQFVQAAHMDLTKAAADSHTFMVAYRDGAAAVGVLFDKVAGQLAGPLAAKLNQATASLVAHYDQISRGLELAGRAVIWFMDVVVTGAMRVADAVGELDGWFERLSLRSQHLIEVAGAMLVAWRLLSRGFLTTPLGLVIAGLTTLLLLLDDYAGWRSGKKSAIDWSGMDAGIQGTLHAFETIATAVSSLVDGTIGWEHALEAVAALMAGSWLTRVMAAFTAAGTAAKAAAAASSGIGAGGAAVGAAAAGGGLKTVLRSAIISTILEQIASGVDEHVPALEKLDDAIFGSIARGLKEMLGIGTASAAGVPGAAAIGAGGAGAAGGPGAPTGGTATDAAHAMSVLMGLGWSRNQAAGLAANIETESGFRANRVGDGGQAYGLGQWHPDRQANFARWAGHDIRQSSVDEQLRFMDFELRRGTERAAGAALAMVQSAREAGAVVSSRYERPRDVAGNMLVRGQRAEMFATTPLMRSDGASVARAGDTTKNVPVTITNNTIIHGAGDPQATGAAVTDAQQRTVPATVRALRGAVS